MFFLLLLLPVMGHSAQKSESFIVQINDRSMSVVSAETKRPMFAIIVENRSLSTQVGKFTVQGKQLKFVSVEPGETETVEIENRSNENVYFVPVSPAFQEVELRFGKRSYEIPSKE
jgi:hypothetical protein